VRCWTVQEGESVLQEVMERKLIRSIRWDSSCLAVFVSRSFQQLANRKRFVADKSPWWFFSHEWPKKMSGWVSEFIDGTYRFQPMRTSIMPDETLTMWSYRDRLFVRALLFLIKPVFQHIISPRCLHLRGPSGVKSALDLVKKALQSGEFKYFIRTDIKSYYASIDQNILVNQLKKHFQDERVLNYLEQIITISVDQDGVIRTPKQGIQRRSSLSPFLSALYLTDVDKAFENRTGIYYLRFCDDILILAKTRRQLSRAKRRLYQMFAALKLKISPHKTKQGDLSKGFHFLGIQFEMNTTDAREVSTVQGLVAQTQAFQNPWNMTLHERCYVRSLAKVLSLRSDAVHPAKIQRYLVSWLTWWTHACKTILPSTCIPLWVQRALRDAPELTWLGRGLLLGNASCA